MGMVHWSQIRQPRQEQRRCSNQGRFTAFQCGAQKWGLGSQESAWRILGFLAGGALALSRGQLTKRKKSYA